MNLDAEPQIVGNPKLPLWATIRFSYSTYFKNFTDVLRISWLWILIVAPLEGAATWLELYPLSVNAKGAILLPPIVFIISLLAYSSIAVAWHRRLILDEHPGFNDSHIFNKNLWRYIKISIVISLIFTIIMTPIIVSIVVLENIVESFPIRILGPFIALTCGIVVFVRLILLLPARAVGDTDLTIQQTWKRTRGNSWRLFLGLATYFLFPTLITIPLYVIVGHTAIVSALSTICNMLTVPLTVGFISQAYQHFFSPHKLA